MNTDTVLFIIAIIGFIGSVTMFAVKVSGVIQKNTDAINNLTTRLNEITVDNDEDHASFYKNINNLKTDMAVLKQRHTDDIELIKSGHYEGR